jgi:hypothetical protein
MKCVLKYVELREYDEQCLLSCCNIQKGTVASYIEEK